MRDRTDEIRDGGRRPTGSHNNITQNIIFINIRHSSQRTTPGRYLTIIYNIIYIRALNLSLSLFLSIIVIILFDYNLPRDRVNDRNKIFLCFFHPGPMYVLLMCIRKVYLVFFLRKLI